MKKFLTIFFITLGVIFFILLLFGTYFYITDPLNLKPLLFGSDVEIAQETALETGDDAVVVDANPLLSEKQEQVLEAVGINPADVPSEITAQQETCFEEAVGIDRVAEIKAGDAPTLSEILKGKKCL